MSRPGNGNQKRRQTKQDRPDAAVSLPPNRVARKPAPSTPRHASITGNLVSSSLKAQLDAKRHPAGSHAKQKTATQSRRAVSSSSTPRKMGQGHQQERTAPAAASSPPKDSASGGGVRGSVSPTSVQPTPKRTPSKPKLRLRKSNSAVRRNKSPATQVTQSRTPRNSPAEGSRAACESAEKTRDR